MAYVPELDEQNKSNLTNPALPTTGGGGGTAPSNASAPGGAAQPAPQGGSQGFANINQYLGANQGQGQTTANTIASNLGNQYTTLQGDINNAANQATEAIKGGTTAYDPNLVNSAVANPSQFVADPNNLAAWQKQYAAQYTGPTAFENTAGYGQAANAANKANQTYQLGQSGGGYSQLLNQIEKNPTVGRTALDKALIQSDPNAQKTIQEAINPFKGVGDYLTGKSADINKQATEAAQNTADTKTKTAENLNTAETNLANDVTGRYQQGLNNQTAYNKQITDLQNAYQPYENAINKYETNVGKDYGDPFAYYKQFQPSQTAVTPESMATQSQFANEAALEKLSGQPLNILSNTNQPDYTQFRNTNAYNSAMSRLQNGTYTPEDLNLLSTQTNKTAQGEYGSVPGFNPSEANFRYTNTPDLTQLNPTSQWYTKALLDAASQNGYNPNSALASPEYFLSGKQGHPRNPQFDQLLNELNKLNPNIHPL